MATAIQIVPDLTGERPEESRHARVIARFFFATFWMILFTGAVRKWLLPGVSILYLLQDVPIGLAYLYALWTGLVDRGYFLIGILILAVMLCMQGILQIIVTGLSPFVALVGAHNYLFYLPMLVVFPLCLTEKYRRNFIRWNLLASIPMCVLAIAQAQSPVSAWVNRTSQGDAFGLPGVEIARVSGTFNFTVFYGIWVSIAVALNMGEWLLPQHRRVIQSRWLLLLCTFTVNVCHLVSGSRSAIFLAGIAILGGLVGAAVLGSTRSLAAIAGICLLLPLAAGMTYVISPTEYNVVMDRLTGENGKADIKYRLADGLIGWVTIPKLSLLGAGIGMGVDAAHVGNVDTYNFTYTLSEGDTIRNVMELGTPVGVLYMMTRVCFLLGMAMLALRITREGSTPHVLPLAFCLMAQAYQGDLTRAATMTSSQVFLGYAFLLSAYYYPDNNAGPSEMAGDSLTRTV